ncbi:MAG: 30S ribosomal protein S6 [Bdellovibrionales bacterium]
MPLYESIFIARQDVPAAQVETLSTGFADIVGKLGGTVTKTEQWGLRNLTYRIKKNKKGHYVLFNIDAPPAAIAELERNMSLNEDVLRYLTVRVEEHEAGPSAMLRKDERADRPFGDRPRRPRDSDAPVVETSVAGEEA